MHRFFRISIVLCIITIISGCTGFRHEHALRSVFYPSSVGNHRVLAVLLPGIGGDGSLYETRGFIDAVREREFEADIKVLNVAPRMYLDKKIVDVLKIEVFSPAVREGYEEIHLVGISLGGHGALLYATEYPHDVEVVIVIAPFLGGSVVRGAINDAGGLEYWEDCPFMSWNYACRFWRSVKDYMSHPRKRTNLYLGYGTNDMFAAECRILAGMLPPENVFTVSGGHEWSTWKKLWLIALDHFRIIRSDRQARIKKDDVSNIE